MGRALDGYYLVLYFWQSMFLLTLNYGVQASPRCMNKVSDVTAVVGTTVLLPCLLDKKFGFEWGKQADQSLLTLHQEPRFVQSRQGLVIQNVKREDAGKYQVKVHGEESVIHVTVNLHVKALSESDGVTVKKVREGETTTLHCGNSPTEGQSTVRWVNGIGIGIGITGNDVINRYSSVSNGTLVVSPVTRGDSGEYVCVRTITTQRGSYETSVKWFLDVLYEALIIDLDGSIIAQENSEVLMKCVSIGNPTPTTTWSLPNSNTMYSANNGNNNNNNNNSNNNNDNDNDKNDTLTVFTNGSLILWMARRSEAGKYNCSANNGVGNPDVRTADLQVMYGPEFTTVLPTFNTITIKEDEQVIFDCSSTANPTPHISWSHDDVTLTSTDVTYSVRSARLNDSGVYVCKVASAGKQVNRTFNIVVKGRPWTPRSLKVSVSNDQVRFSWTPAPNGGLETTFELWFRQTDETDMHWDVVTSHDDIITMKSKSVMTSEEKKMYCSVRSVNSEGVSEFSPVVLVKIISSSSDVSTEVMDLLADAPLVPTNLSLNYSTDGFYTLQWMYIRTPGRPLATHFQIEYRDQTNTTEWKPYRRPSRSRRGMVSTRVVGDFVRKDLYMDDIEVVMFRVFAVAENGKQSAPASFSIEDGTVIQGSRIINDKTDIIPPLILGIIFVFFFVILLVSLYCFCRRKKRKPPGRGDDTAVKNKSDLIVETHSMEFDDECKLFAPKPTALPFLGKPSPYTVKITAPDSPALFHLPLCPALQLGKCSKRNGDTGLDNGGVRHSDIRNADDVYFLLEAHPKERATCTCGDVTHVSLEGSGNSKSSPSTLQDSAPSSPPSSHGAHACDEFSDDYNSDEMNKLCVNELNNVRKQVLNRFNFKDSYDQFCAPGEPDCPPPSYRGHSIPYKELSVVEKTEADKNMDDNNSEDSVPESERRMEAKLGIIKGPQPHLKAQPPAQYNPNTKFYDIKSIDKFEECNSTSSDPDSISFLRTTKNNNNSNNNINKNNVNSNVHRLSLKSGRDNGYCSDSPAFTDSGIHDQPRRSITPSQGFDVYSDDESFTRLSPTKGHRSKRPPTYNQAIIDIERMSERNDVTDSEEMFDKLILMEQQLGVQLSDSLDSQINMPVPSHPLSTTLPGKYRQPHSKNSSDTGYISDVPLGSDAATRYSSREKSVRCAQLLTEFRSSKPDGMQLLDSSDRYSDQHSSHNNTSNSMEDDSTELTTLRTHSSASNSTPQNEWLV